MSSLVFWRNGVVWRREGIPGWAWLRFIPQRQALVWCTFDALHITWLARHTKGIKYTPPAGFVFLNYVLAIDQTDKPLIAVPAEGANVPSFHPLAFFKLETVDPVSGEVARAQLGGFPLTAGFYGRTLWLGTMAFALSHAQRFFLDKFEVRTNQKQLTMRRISHSACPGLVQSYAGDEPVVVNRRGDQAFVGPIKVGLGTIDGPVKHVVGAQGQILVVSSSGDFGTARAPDWQYRRLGHLPTGDIVGEGRNRAGFWLAQPGLQITLIGWTGAVRTVNVKIREVETSETRTPP